MTIGVNYPLISSVPANTTLESLRHSILRCRRCPRLVEYRERIAREKKREFKEWDYWGKPVPGFGDPLAAAWIVGLAPAAHGANRTGRMFTGDSSGNWLYRELYNVGFAAQPNSTNLNDGQKLNQVFVSAAVRCAPPDNKPTKEEMHHCKSYLDAEFQALKNVRVFLVLGKIAFDSVLQLLARQGYTMPSPKLVFAHGARYQIQDKTILISYHPSRQNTQTGRLTEEMWANVFLNLKGEVKKSSL